MPYQLKQPFYERKLPHEQVDALSSQIGIVLSITLLASGAGWQFQWPSTGAAYYRIVLRGKQIETIIDETNGLMTYVYDGVGFTTYPPPLEIMEEEVVAASELNRPFLTIQWYGMSSVAYYLLQEFVAPNWITRFEIAEINAAVYSWTSPLLADESIHTYRVLAYNAINQESDPLEFDITPVVTPPDFNEDLYTVFYDGTAHEIVFDLE